MKKELSKKIKVIMIIITILHSLWFIWWLIIGIAAITDPSLREENLWFTLILAIIMLIPYILIFASCNKSNNKKSYLTIAMTIEIIGILLSIFVWLMWPVISPSINTDSHPCEVCSIMKFIQ